MRTTMDTTVLNLRLAKGTRLEVIVRPAPDSFSQVDFVFAQGSGSRTEIEARAIPAPDRPEGEPVRAVGTDRSEVTLHKGGATPWPTMCS
jgi:hypothetical protein